MSSNTILKNVLEFTSLVIGTPTSLPHLLNINGRAVAPQLGGADAAGFIVTADDTDVTVTRTATGPAAVNVYVEHWHTLEEVLPLPGRLTGLTPFFFASGIGDGGESVFSNFVFRPGGTAGGNVYTDWATLVAATSLVQGVKSIQFDDSLSTPCVIPAGVWDMTQTYWTSYPASNASSFVAVRISDGASFTDLRKISGYISVTNLNNTTAPVVISAAAGARRAFEFGADGEGFPQITNSGTAPFFDCSALTAGQQFLLRCGGQITGSSAAIQFGASPGTLALVLFEARIFSGMIAGTNVAAIINILLGMSGMNRQNSWAGVINRGKPNTVFSVTAGLGGTQYVQTYMFPAPVNQVASPPSTIALTPSTGAGMNVTYRLNATGGVIAQVLPQIRAAAPAIGSSNAVAGVLNSEGMIVIIKEFSGINGVSVTPDGTTPDTLEGGAGAIVVPAGGARIFQSDGISDWRIIGGYL